MGELGRWRETEKGGRREILKVKQGADERRKREQRGQKNKVDIKRERGWKE